MMCIPPPYYYFYISLSVSLKISFSFCIFHLRACNSSVLKVPVNKKKIGRITEKIYRNMYVVLRFVVSNAIWQVVQISGYFLIVFLFFLSDLGWNFFFPPTKRVVSFPSG